MQTTHALICPSRYYGAFRMKAKRQLHFVQIGQKQTDTLFYNAVFTYRLPAQLFAAQGPQLL
jgi:hypothetical protein